MKKCLLIALIALISLKIVAYQEQWAFADNLMKLAESNEFSEEQANKLIQNYVGSVQDPFGSYLCPDFFPGYTLKETVRDRMKFLKRLFLTFARTDHDLIIILMHIREACELLDKAAFYAMNGDVDDDFWYSDHELVAQVFLSEAFGLRMYDSLIEILKHTESIIGN